MEPKESNLNKTIIRGIFWTYNTFYGGKLLVFISTIILARLLSKEDFGIVGFALLVISFLTILEDLGIGRALIYYHEDRDAIHTGFWLGLGIGLTLFGVTWYIAPLAAMFFDDSRVIPMTRVLALTFPISALGNVHSSLLQKRLHFKQKFIPEIAKMGGKGLIAISLALLGFGAWSLVYGQLFGVIIAVIAYWGVLPFRPSFHFSRQMVRPLLSYGTSLVLVSAMAMLSTNADYLFVGRFLGAAALGVYTIAYRIPEMIIFQISKVIAQVLFPAYTKLRDNPPALQHAFLVTIRYVSIITIPLGLGMALVAEPLVLTLFTAKWIEAVPVVRAISIYTLLFSLGSNAGSIYKSQGQPMLMVKLSTLRTIFLLPALWWATHGPGTIAAVGWTQAIIALFSGSLNLIVAARMVKVPLMEIVLTLRPAIISGFVMALAVAGVLLATTTAPPLVQLMSAAVTGAIVYVAVLWWLQQQLVLQLGRTLHAALVRR